RTGFTGDGAQVWTTEGQGLGPWRVWQAATLGGVLRPFLAPGMEPAWSPDGNKIAYHTADSGDPIFIADRTGNNPRRVLAQCRGGHCHYLIWSLDGQFIYFVMGTPVTEETDIWRIRADATTEAAIPERITNHNARVAYPAWLDDRTLIYSATAED